jgi:PAT family beta-lactamase induction signal transducer AmpG
MRLPNLLATRNGRLTAFFFLYVTEGVPLGFAATAVATQLRRQGIGPAEIGAFVGLFYVPWAFKWAFGPFIDVFRSKRFGHRRAWILFTQTMMVLTLLSLMFVPLPQGLALFTGILLVHNSFGAMQDVAIDSLAVNTLAEDERGLANGLMFGGASIGQAVGASGVLFLMSYIPFPATFVFVSACILGVTGSVVLPMKEAFVEGMKQTAGTVGEAVAEMREFAAQSFRSFVGSRGAYAGVFFALLPAGAMSLGVALQSNLAVEFGMKDDEIAWLNLITLVLSAVMMVVGGWLSDRLGRSKTLAAYLLLMSPPVLYLMFVLQQHGYVMARQMTARNDELCTALWIASLTYYAAQGLMYGTKTAAFMDVTNPKVAATQFTAYMAMSNLAIAFAATWQGLAVEAFGYPTTLLIDAITGPLCVLLIPRMTAAAARPDSLGGSRARISALVLGVSCLSFLAYWPLRDQFGAGQPIMSSFYTLIFVASGLFLLAGREVLGAAAGALRRPVLWLFLPLMALYARNFMDDMKDQPALIVATQVLCYAVPLLAGVVLVMMGRRGWQALTEPAAVA